MADNAVDVEAELRNQIASLQKENLTLAGQFKELALSKYTPEQRAKAEKALQDIELQSDLKAERQTLNEQAQELYAQKLILDNPELTLNREDLLKAKNTTEAELFVAKAKVALLEGKSGDKGGDGKGGDKKDLSKVNSDSGSGGGTSAGASDPLTGKGRDYVASIIGKARMEKAGKV